MELMLVFVVVFFIVVVVVKYVFYYVRFVKRLSYDNIVYECGMNLYLYPNRLLLYSFHCFVNIITIQEFSVLLVVHRPNIHIHIFLIKCVLQVAASFCMMIKMK